jgi:hypothetical protein
MRRIVVAAAMVLSFSGAAAAAAGESKRPRPLVIAAGGERVTATLGSYCVTHGDSGECADALYPLRVHGRLEVRPGRRIELRTHDRRVAEVRVRGLRVHDRDIKRGDWVVVVAGDRLSRRIRVRLPDELDGINRLDVSLRYRGSGDADYWARIAVRRPG